VGAVPIADWCERLLYCNYEEDLINPDVTKRWMELDSGNTLFHFLRDPISFKQYTGRDTERIGIEDGGGARFLSTLSASDDLIPVDVDRSAAALVAGGCTTLCFPRLVTLQIGYHQVTRDRKRIIFATLILDTFDKDATKDDYKFKLCKCIMPFDGPALIPRDL
jgi:hypothetical protein